MAPVSHNLPLPFAATPLPARPPSAGTTGGAALAAVSGTRLWLCLQLPELPLEVMAPGEAPQAILTGTRHQAVVLHCDEAAARCGVCPGMSTNAALALVPGLALHERAPGRERAALEGLATVALGFTPQLALESDALLLEIAASLPLFGGVAALRAAAVAAVEARGHQVRAAMAPTARAALWLARLGHAAPVTEPARLAGALAGLPVAGLGWPAGVQQSLRRLGVTRLGECLRLPRDGLARRIGTTCLQELDEALGRVPEVRPAWRDGVHWRDELELPAATCAADGLLEALRVLLDRLTIRLRARQSGATVLQLGLRHRRQPATALRIGLLQPSADPARLADLAGLYLSATRLPAPVEAIVLEAGIAAAGTAVALPGLGYDRGERVAGLIERLRLRLGLHAVHGLAAAPEHRPEHAWQVTPVPCTTRGATNEPLPGKPRPLWLLAQPAALDVRAGAPLFEGLLTLERGPERIESGWWDGHDVRRDYYVARNRRGLRAWVFRDCRAGGWYLHGLFG